MSTPNPNPSPNPSPSPNPCPTPTPNPNPNPDPDPEPNLKVIYAEMRLVYDRSEEDDLLDDDGNGMLPHP